MPTSRAATPSSSPSLDRADVRPPLAPARPARSATAGHLSDSDRLDGRRGFHGCLMSRSNGASTSCCPARRGRLMFAINPSLPICSRENRCASILASDSDLLTVHSLARALKHWPTRSPCLTGRTLRRAQPSSSRRPRSCASPRLSTRCWTRRRRSSSRRNGALPPFL